MQSKVVLLAVCLASLSGVCSSAHAQGGFGPPDLTLVPVEGKDNIYLIRNQFAGNITVLVGDEGVILVDTKTAPDHDGVLEFVRTITDAPVKYVINTHLHPDHTGGNPPLRDLGIAIVASENARRIMAQRAQSGLPNITMRDSLRIWLDDMPIDLRYFGRGHTDGDIVVHLPTENTLITGDLFALYGPYRAVIDYTAGASLRDWTRTLERMLQLDFETVIPGHSGVTDRANVEGYIEYLTRTQAMVWEMNAQDRSREEIQAMLREELDWGGLEMQVGLDGVITEMQ